MWSRDIPKEDGWYWVRYRVGLSRRREVTCPSLVMNLGDVATVHTARNVLFSSEDRDFFGMKDAEFWTLRLLEPPPA